MPTPLIQTLNCLLLRSGIGPVVLLRPIASDFDPDTDDVDLLLTEEHRAALLQAALEESAAGRIHFSVRQKCSEKIQLTLWNLATSQRLTVDLWSVFCQLPNHPRMMIRAENLLRFAGPESHPRVPGSGTTRLSADVDFCLLVLHLAVKAKPLSSVSVRERIRQASDRLVASIPELFTVDRPSKELASLIEVSEGLRIAARTIPTRSIRIAEDFLLSRLGGLALQPRTNRMLLTGIRNWLMKRVPCVAVVGSDGAGKSSVCKVVSQQRISGTSPIVAKKLYRCSWLYRIVSSAAKRITGIDRDRFDNSIAPLITLRAAGSLWLRFTLQCLTPRRHVSLRGTNFVVFSPQAPPSSSVRRKVGMPLLDRSLGSFLITNRKSAHPRVSRLGIWLEHILPPVTTLLLAVPFRSLVRRKAEFTSTVGHARYQQLLFEQAQRQRPCDLVVVANTGSAADAASAFRAIRASGKDSFHSENLDSLTLPGCREERTIRSERAA